MPTAFIEDLKVVDDLAEDEIAVPRKDTAYVVYPIDGHGKQMPVARVIRRGDCLYAVSIACFERCIAGEGACFAIRARYTGRDAALRRWYGGR